MKATGKRRNARCAPICTHNAQRDRGRQLLTSWSVERATVTRNERCMAWPSCVSASLTSFTDSVLSSLLLSQVGMEVGLGQIERAGGRGGGRRAGVWTNDCCYYTHRRRSRYCRVIGSVRPSVRPPQTAEVRVELGGDRERGSPTVFGLPAFGIMDGVVEFQIGW